MNTALEIRGVSKTFKTRAGTVEAVKNVSFSIQPGEVVALLGENGAGKSTLIDMILGLSSPTSGSLQLMGMSPERAVRQSQVNAVLQTGGLLKDLSVKDQVAMIAATYAQKPDVEAALEAAGIADIANRKISKCSGGQQQKVKFAIALLGDPSIIILDEPTTGMDVNARATFWKSMHAQAQAGKTIIFATHYLEEAEEFADRIIMMAHGQLIADGTTQEIRAANGVRKVSFELDATNQLSFTAPQEQTWGITNFQRTETTPSVSTYSMHCVEVEQLLTHLLPNYAIRNLQVLQPSLSDAFSKLAEA